MATGLNYLFEIDPGVTTQVILIAVISIVATFSAVSGVGNGIRIISEWNIWLSVVLLAYFLFGGPFQWLMGFFVTAVGDYLWNVIPMGFQTFNEPGASAWQGGWDHLLLGLVDLLGAVRRDVHRPDQPRAHHPRVHARGDVRTDHDRLLWLCIFGGNAMYLELTADGGVGTAGIAQLVRDWNLSSALYGTIERMTDVNWLNWVMAALATFLLATWFITSSDSGTLVITTMLSMGDDDPPQRSGSCGGSARGSWRRPCCSPAA